MVGVGKGMEKAKADAGDLMTPLRLEEVYFGVFLESGLLENDQQPAFGLCSPWSNESDHVFILFHLRSGRKLSLSVCAVSTDQRLGVKGTSIHLMSSLMSAGHVDVTLPLRVVSQIWDEARWNFRIDTIKKHIKTYMIWRMKPCHISIHASRFTIGKRPAVSAVVLAQRFFQGIQRCQALSWNASLCAATSGQLISAGVPFPSTPSASFVWMVLSFKTFSDFHCRCRCRDILIVHETWRNTVKTSSAIHWLRLLFCNDGRQLGPEQGSLLSSKVTYVVLIDWYGYLLGGISAQLLDLWADRWWTQRFISRVVKGGLMVVASRCRCVLQIICCFLLAASVFSPGRICCRFTMLLHHGS